MEMKYSVTLESSNKKTGKIPVTTSPKQTCPSSCPHKDTTCYAGLGPLDIHWGKVSSGERGITFNELLDIISDLPNGTLWRHNQAGDLVPYSDGDIGTLDLMRLVKANSGKKGFTYTHYPMNEHNQRCVQLANELGFTINLSADTYEQAKAYKELKVGPVCVVVQHDEVRKNWTVDGVDYILCPNVHSGITCKDCGICATQRKAVVAFPVHGARKKKWVFN